MTDEVQVSIQLKDATENFGARIQVKGFKLIDVKVVKKEALSLDSKFSDLLNRRLHGRLDSRKEKEREQAAATKSTGDVAVVPRLSPQSPLRLHRRPKCLMTMCRSS